MSYHTFQHYTFDENLPFEPTLNYQSNPEIILRDLQNQLQLRQLANSRSLSIPSFITLNNLPINPWIPSRKFSNLLTVSIQLF